MANEDEEHSRGENFKEERRGNRENFKETEIIEKIQKKSFKFILRRNSTHKVILNIL